MKAGDCVPGTPVFTRAGKTAVVVGLGWELDPTWQPSGQGPPRFVFTGSQASCGIAVSELGVGLRRHWRADVENTRNLKQRPEFK